MSWIGGSISSLTGQLSNLTKDILTEGTEEVSDHATELRIANEKIQELQQVVSSQKSENDRLKRINHELEEKAESSELQINSISREYRTLLEDKEKEVNSLKRSHDEILQHQANSAVYGGSTQSSHDAHGFENSEFVSDGLDFGDNINLQHEINRLKHEVQSLQSENKHWRSVASNTTPGETTHKSSSHAGRENVDLQNKLKELEEQLRKEKEEHQNEVASLQDIHSQKMAMLRKKVKSEITEYKNKISGLEDQLKESSSVGVTEVTGNSNLQVQLDKLQSQLQAMTDAKTQVETEKIALQESLRKISAELEEAKSEKIHLESSLSSVTEQVREYEKKLQTNDDDQSAVADLRQQLKAKEEELRALKLDYEKVCSGLQTTKYRLLDQLDANHAQSLELLCDLQEVRRQMNSETISRRNKFLKEKQDLVNNLISTGCKQTDLRDTVTELEYEQERVAMETDQMVTDIGDMEHQKLTKDIMDGFEKENLHLKHKNVQLQEQVVLLEKALKTVTEERQTTATEMKGHKERRDSLETADSDVQSMASDLSELSNRNKDLVEQVCTLNRQIETYEQEVQSFEDIRSDWQTEKEALEEVLMQLREQVREKEESLNVMEAEKGLSMVKKQGSQRRRQTDSTNNHPGLLEIQQQEIQEYNTDSEESDSDTGDISVDIEKLDHKVELLTHANAALERERDKLLLEKNSMEEELKLLKSTATSTAGKEPEEQNTEKDKVIVELTEEKNALEASLEELDAQHQMAMEQLIKMRDDLQNKNKELVKSVQDKDQTIEKLTKVIDRKEEESKRMDDLEEELFNLRDKNEELESQLSKKESSTKNEPGKEKEIAELKEKLQNGAMAVNDLHMDIKDLEKKLSQSKKLVGEKVETIKHLREKNEEYQEFITVLNEKVSSSEANIDSLKKSLSENNDARSKSEVDHLQKQLDEKAEEMQGVVSELESVSNLLADYMDRYTKLQMENSDLICKVSDRDNQIRDLKESGGQEIDQRLQEYQEQMEQLRAEKLSLERDLSQSEQVLQSKVQHYENYIEEMQQNQEMDSLQQEHQDLLQTSHEKDLEISNLSVEVETLKSYLDDSKDMMQKSKDEQDHMTQAVRDKEVTLNQLKLELSDITEERDGLLEQVKQMTESLEKMQSVHSQLQTLKDENSYLQREVETLRQSSAQDKEADRAKTVEVITDLEVEISAANDRIESLQVEIRQYKEAMRDHEKEVKDLKEQRLKQSNELSDNKAKLEQQEDTIAVLEQSAVDSEQEVSALRKKLGTAVSLLDKDKQSLIEEVDTENIPIKLQQSAVLEYPPTPGVEHLSVTKENENLKERLELVQQENETLKMENENLQEKSKIKSDKTVEEVTQLESELRSIVDKLEHSEKVSQLDKEEIGKRDNRISDLCAREQELEMQLQNITRKLDEMNETTATLQERSAEKQQENAMLHKKLDSVVSLIDKNKQNIMDTQEWDEMLQDLVTLKHTEKGSIEVMNVSDVKVEKVTPLGSHLVGQSENSNGFDNMDACMENEEDVGVKLNELQTLLREKDKVIAEVQTNNSSLMKMLETKSISALGDRTLVDVHKLENEVRSLKLEKEQILAVMNEKSRECSNLKSEVHRLMNVISAEKVALDKLQKDNHELNNSREKSPVEEMQKEALQNLSRLIRDKDVEVEALTQKNQTLLACLQESSSDGPQLSGLMQDKENLTKQLTTLQSEREQMITYLNQKHQESLSYHNEIQRLTALVQSQTEKYQQLEHDYANLVPQFEAKNQALLKTQNELINHKQKFTELELKYGEVIQRTNASETVDLATHTTKLDELQHCQEKLKELLDSLKEKEMKIQMLHQQNMEYEEQIASRDSEISNLKKQTENLMFKYQSVQTELNDLRNEKSVNEQQSVEQTSHLHLLKESNNRLTLELQDKDFELTSLQEKCRTLSEMIQNKEGEKGQLNQLMQENESVLTQAKQIQQERDQALMALKQRQMEIEEIHKEVQKYKDKDDKSQRELYRLRNHLLQVEEGYTKEAVEAEEREKDLRNRLAVAEEKLHSSSSVIEVVNQQASLQTESLQQQLHAIATQRDQAFLQVSSLQDQCQQYASSLANLQMVLEQFQKEKDLQASLEMERYQKEVSTLQKQNQQLQTTLKDKSEKLQEAEEGIEAASRLSEQLDRKEEAIAALKEEVQIRERALKAFEEEAHRLKVSTENKVDKIIIKNLFLGYFTTPKSRQPEVLHAVGGVLDFTAEDFQKISGTGRSWVQGIFRFGGASPAPPVTSPITPSRVNPLAVASTVTVTPKSDRSFSALFVKFLENESTPPPPTMKLPAEEMARDVQRQKEAHKPAYNPFTAPRHVSMPDNEQQHHRDSPILMSSGPLSPTIPLYTPVTAADPVTPTNSGRSTPANTSSAILKDVLGSR